MRKKYFVHYYGYAGSYDAWVPAKLVRKTPKKSEAVDVGGEKPPSPEPNVGGSDPEDVADGSEDRPPLPLLVPGDSGDDADSDADSGSEDGSATEGGQGDVSEVAVGDRKNNNYGQRA